MREFLIKSIKFFIFCYIFLWVLQGLVDYGLRKTDVGFYKEYNAIYNGTINADLVVIGSSRAWRHFDPEILETKTDLLSYNLGGSKLTFDIQKIKLNGYLSNNKSPKVAIINVDINSLANTKELYDKDQYLPYYTRENYSLFKTFDTQITMEYFMPMYKYRGYYNQVVEGVLSALIGYKPERENIIKGYAPRNLEWDEAAGRILKNEGPKRLAFNAEKLMLNTAICDHLDVFAKEDAVVFIVWSPEHQLRLDMEEPALSKIRSYYKDLAQSREDVFFIDFTRHPIVKDKSYFYDSYHLNEQGATLFSGWVSDSINKYYSH